MSTYKPKNGDRVRVVIEGEVEQAGAANGFRIKGDWVVRVDPDGGMAVSVEKIEPPVEVFKPGDFLRSKACPGYRYALGNGGYFSFQLNEWFPKEPLREFTSDRFEKVELPR